MTSCKTGHGKAVFVLLSLRVIFSKNARNAHKVTRSSQTKQSLQIFKKNTTYERPGDKVNVIGWLCGLFLPSVKALGTNTLINNLTCLC